MKQAVKYMLGFLMLWAAVAQAEVRIEITQGVDSARPIGIVPFRVAGGALYRKKSALSLLLTCVTAGNLTRSTLTVCHPLPATASEVVPESGRR